MAEDAPVPTVLIVEDDENALRGLQLLVEGEGFEVWLATCLLEARDHLEAAVPEILLSDVMLPDGLGTELLDELDTERTAVIFVSGRMDAEMVQQAMGSGAYDCLKKPLDVARLTALLDQLRDGLTPDSSAH